MDIAQLVETCASLGLQSINQSMRFIVLNHVIHMMQES